ncbi:MAG: hypothetical protein CMC11_02990 [Flavobacteriaceae bacterium]|nr:hypothetical protein [Flavobacteriaceae bacterium]
MFGISKVMISIGVIILTLLYFASSNVCRYNFAIEKKTNQLNLITKEITPALPLTKIYYFKEINCNKVDISWSLSRIFQNLSAISVMIYQEITTDINSVPN